MIEFIINKQEHIKIGLPCDLKNLLRYDEVTVFYSNSATDKKYVIDNLNVIIDVLKDFQYRIQQLINHELKLDASITQNIGYLWNQYFGSIRDKRHKKPHLAYCTSTEGKKYWVGQNYILLETPSNQIPTLTTWLYEKGETFFLEITPNYPPDYRWNYMKLKDAKKDPNFKTFKQFMQTYQPLVVTTIERSVLELWNIEIHRLISIIEANDSKYCINR